MKKFLYNHFIWIKPYWIFFSLFFGFILFLICGTTFFSTWYNVESFPYREERYEVEGKVKEFHPQSSGNSYHIEIVMENGEKYYIQQSMRRAYSWNQAIREIKPGTYIQMIVINETNAIQDPQIMSLTYSGKTYLSIEDGKAILDFARIEAGRVSLRVLCVVVVLWLYLSFAQIIQVVIIQKKGCRKQ